LHIPYCAWKCGYCAFNSRPLRAPGEHDAYLRALTAELRLRSAELRALTVETVYFGGGTPSLAPPDALADLLRTIRDAVGPGSEVVETTLEANPEGLTRRGADGLSGEERLARLRDAGFDRLSLGIQSFDEGALGYLERRHAPGDGPAAVAAARRAGFDNLSVDLIVGLPEPHDRCHLNDVVLAIERCAPEHLSLYLLGIEEPSRLACAVASGRAAAPLPEAQADAYLGCEVALVAAGYEHYEVSNFARPGRRARHNAAYWSGAPYLGLGAGAHSYLIGAGGRTFRRANLADADAYVRTLSDGLDPTDFMEPIDPETERRERLMLALRTTEGINPGAFGAASEALDRRLARLAQRGLFTPDGGRWRPTAEGFLHADGLTVELWEALAETG
jgi:oxygen-independent coproporphyrinogen-3 oxidase